LAIWRCCVYALLISLICVSMHLSFYLHVSCIYRPLCFPVYSDLSCLSDWLIDWLRGTRMFNYSAVQEIPCHYEIPKLDHATPSLEADQSISMSPQPIPVQDWFGYYPSFVLTAEVVSSSDIFVGLNILYEVIVQSVYVIYEHVSQPG
jgi:hypothetical protein